MLLTRSPLGFCLPYEKQPPSDLHVLGTPPAFILSQDQTLRSSLLPCLAPQDRRLAFPLDDGTRPQTRPVPPVQVLSPMRLLRYPTDYLPPKQTRQPCGRRQTDDFSASSLTSASFPSLVCPPHVVNFTPTSSSLEPLHYNILLTKVQYFALSQIKCDSAGKGGCMGSKAMLGLTKW